MDQILIAWLENYSGTIVTLDTTFNELNFDVFDEAMTVDFVHNQFHCNVNIDHIWFATVRELVNVISAST
jgi:acyl carrier protein